ncbi:hypothetical protein P9209_14505 [Prescottella defluvii]|nr:hypothetical protein P9209_14505 [Prescottella defluvii]
MTRMTEAPGEMVGRLREAVEELRDPMLEFLSGSVRCASVSGNEDTIHGFLTDWFGLRAGPMRRSNSTSRTPAARRTRPRSRGSSTAATSSRGPGRPATVSRPSC